VDWDIGTWQIFRTLCSHAVDRFCVVVLAAASDQLTLPFFRELYFTTIEPTKTIWINADLHAGLECYVLVYVSQVEQYMPSDMISHVSELHLLVTQTTLNHRFTTQLVHGEITTTTRLRFPS